MTTPFQNIIVFVDSADSSMKAAEFAVRLAACASARLTAVSVVDTDTLKKLLTARILVEQEMAEFEADLAQSQNRTLEYVKHLAARAGVAMEAVMGKGVASSVVLAEQKARQADLIVMGGFRCTLTRLDLASAERQRILDVAVCPVLVVK
jgi:nucleotide-binding universal stress UspA family protein